MIANICVNRQLFTEEIQPSMTLLRFIREVAGLTGTKNGCEEGECGACTVLLNGRAVRSCLVLAVEADGCDILTIEGLKGEGEGLHPLQQAFVDAGAIQCGFCTPGMILAAKALLDSHPHPTDDQIREYLGGHICRCGTYLSVARAVKMAAGQRKHEGGQIVE